MIYAALFWTLADVIMGIVTVALLVARDEDGFYDGAILFFAFLIWPIVLPIVLGQILGGWLRRRFRTTATEKAPAWEEDSDL